MMKTLLWKLTRKGFYIELEAENMFPYTKGFVYPNESVMRSAIEKYCVQNKHELKYLSIEKPIKIQLDGKEIYNAELELKQERGRRYVIHCLEAKEEQA